MRAYDVVFRNIREERSNLSNVVKNGRINNPSCSVEATKVLVLVDPALFSEVENTGVKWRRVHEESARTRHEFERSNGIGSCSEVCHLDISGVEVVVVEEASGLESGANGLCEASRNMNFVDDDEKIVETGNSVDEQI